MRPIRSSKQWRKNPWRVRAVQLALALVGVGLTAIAAAAIGVSTKGQSEGAMAAAILAQQIAEGQPAPAEPPTPAETATREQILQEASTYENDMNQAVSHADQLRLQAYHDKDLIRMNFIASKLADMRQVVQIAQPSFASIRQPGQDLFVMRSKLSTIRQGWESVKESLAAAETSESDSVDSVTAVGSANAEANPSDGVTDPTAPAAPTAAVERPSAASPYR